MSCFRTPDAAGEQTGPRASLHGLDDRRGSKQPILHRSGQEPFAARAVPWVLGWVLATSAMMGLAAVSERGAVANQERVGHAAASFGLGPALLPSATPPQGTAYSTWAAGISEAQTKLIVEVEQTRTLELQRAGQARRFVRVKETFLGLGSAGPTGEPSEPSFVLRDVSIPSAVPGSLEQAEFLRLYARSSGFIFHHQGFAIRNVDAAESNYHWVPLQVSQRLGRPVQQLLILPKEMNRSVWYLEVDQATLYPLLSVEYTPAGVPIHAVQLTAFTPKTSVSTADLNNAWSPWMDKNPALSGQPVQTLGPSMAREGRLSIPAGYVQHRRHVSADPFNGEQSFVVGFTDGIDEMFVVQTHSESAPFAGSPIGSQPNTHEIVRFREQGLVEEGFVWHGLRVSVIGRGTQGALPELTQSAFRDILLQFP